MARTTHPPSITPSKNDTDRSIDLPGIGALPTKTGTPGAGKADLEPEPHPQAETPTSTGRRASTHGDRTALSPETALSPGTAMASRTAASSRKAPPQRSAERSDVLVSAVISTYLLTHLHHVLQRSEFSAQQEGRSALAANYAQLRKVLCLDARTMEDASAIGEDDHEPLQAA